MLVKNNSDKPAKVGRYSVPPGRTCDVPGEYPALWQPRAQGLRSSGVLTFPYYPPTEDAVEEAAKSEEAAPIAEEPIPEAEPFVPDDLTQLVHIGRGRARTMDAAGLMTYADVVDAGAEKLDSMLAIDRDTAEEVVEDAKSRT